MALGHVQHDEVVQRLGQFGDAGRVLLAIDPVVPTLAHWSNPSPFQPSGGFAPIRPAHLPMPPPASSARISSSERPRIFFRTNSLWKPTGLPAHLIRAGVADSLGAGPGCTLVPCTGSSCSHTERRARRGRLS